MAGRHPGAVCIYFLCVLVPMVFENSPVLSALALGSGLLLLFLLRGMTWRRALGYPGIALLSGLINPLFNHSGRTALFFLNRNPVTREAVLYGLVMGMMIAAALVWGRCFTLVMDTDRLMTVTSRLSPKAALVLSMALRYVPLMRRQAERTREAQRGLGLIREENAVDRIRGALRVWDGTVAWGLENGIITADSMAARGYGTGRRTRYRLYAWERADTLWTAAALLLCAVLVLAHVRGWTVWTWYPDLRLPASREGSLAASACYFLLCACGAGAEAADRIRWRRREAGFRAREPETTGWKDEQAACRIETEEKRNL